MGELAIEKTVLKDTLIRIQHSLNCRFERDASLYIDKQQSQELKSMISKGKWQGIHDGYYVTKGISAEILTAQIIKNAWLITRFNRYDRDSINIINILESCDKKIFIENAKNIIDGSAYTSNDFKDLIDEIYYKNIDIDTCKQVISAKDSRIYNQTILYSCLERILDSCETPLELRNVMEKYINEIDHLKGSKLLDKYTKSLFEKKDENWINKFAKEVFNNNIEFKESEKNSSWSQIFLAMNKYTFDLCAEYLEHFGEVDTDSSIKIAKYFMAPQLNIDLNNVLYYRKEWIRLSKIEALKEIMINGVKGVHELKYELLEEMREVITFNNSQSRLIEQMLNPDEPIMSEEDVLQRLSRISKKEPQRTYNYISFKIEESPNIEKIFKDLSEYLSNKKVQRLYISMIQHSYKNANSKKFKQSTKGLIKYIKKEDEMVLYNKLQTLIEANPRSFKNEEIVDFLINYDFDFYKRVFMNN